MPPQNVCLSVDEAEILYYDLGSDHKPNDMKQ